MFMCERERETKSVLTGICHLNKGTFCKNQTKDVRNCVLKMFRSKEIKYLKKIYALALRQEEKRGN